MQGRRRWVRQSERLSSDTHTHTERERERERERTHTHTHTQKDFMRREFE